MRTLEHPRIFFLAYSSFLAVLAILIVGGMLSSPSEPGNSLLLGLSLPRLFLTAGLLISFVFFAALSIKAFRDSQWAAMIVERWFGKSRLSLGISWLAAIGFGLGWIGCFLPFYRAGILGVHWERIRPAMVFLLLASLATLLLIFAKRIHFNIQDWKLSKAYKLSLILFFPAILLLGILLYSKFGVFAREDYWYGAGVPVLVTQLIIALAGGVFFLQVEQRWKIRRFDLLVCLSIYILSAVLWAREPLQKSFLFIGPYPPSRVLYPFADAALFDTASQFALIGQNFLFFNGQFFERALYISFLVYLHSLLGQDYELLMAAQAAIFAVFPALVYLVGKSLDSRAVGFAAGIVAMFKGTNSIAASNMIDMANPKMMLTDFPTAIAMALVIYLACEWLKKPQQKWEYALWLGGVIGLAIMLRTNALFILLLIPLYSLLRFRQAWKPWLASSLLLMLAVVAMTLPWELRNESLGGTMYSSLFTKFQNVIEQRYLPPSQPEGFLPREPGLSATSFKSVQALIEIGSSRETYQSSQLCSQMACFVPNHFLHNILTSILVLPTSPVLDDLRHTVKESYPYWRPDWDGSFPNLSLLIFLLNLFLILSGISLAWQQHRLTGLIPLAVFIFYNLSNGFARTSGGRYIVPIDWILTLYFLIGIFHVIVSSANALGNRWTLFAEPVSPEMPRQSDLRKSAARALGILAILFGLGALTPLAESLHPARYQNYEVAKALAERETQIAVAGLSLPEIDSFLQNPKAEISVGRALYPRYYIENEGEVHFYPVVVMGFPRTTFTLIGPKGEQGIVLPGEKPKHFPHAGDVIILGCKEQFYVDALAVILLDETGTIYTRSPESALQCPLRQPVCDNNHNCY
jgi:hypothetical protein